MGTYRESFGRIPSDEIIMSFKAYAIGKQSISKSSFNEDSNEVFKISEYCGFTSSEPYAFEPETLQGFGDICSCTECLIGKCRGGCICWRHITKRTSGIAKIWQKNECTVVTPFGERVAH